MCNQTISCLQGVNVVDSTVLASFHCHEILIFSKNESHKSIPRYE